MRVTKLLLALVCAVLFSSPARGQNMPAAPGDPCQGAINFSVWINCRVDVIASARMNQGEPRKQVETPSISTSSTSLVDQTSAPDLLGLALNFAGLNNNDGDSTNASSVTSTAYALYTGITGKDALDPAVYNKYAGLRRFSFTVGRDDPDEDKDTNNRAFLFGLKCLIINKRDATSSSNRGDLQMVSNRLRTARPNFLDVAFDVRNYLYEQLGPSLGYPAVGEVRDDAIIRFVNERLSNATQTQATVGMLSIAQHDAINAIISAKIGTIVELKDASLEAFERIRRRPQLSFSFQTKQRREDGSDEYRTGLLYDVGVYQRLNFAANATFDYENNKIIGGDKRGGRLAVESYFHLNRQKNIFNGKDPITLSFQGEGKWMSSAKPTYTGQVKLTLPLFDGVSLPLSFSVANRTELIKESEVRGRFGFTIDFAKLAKAFGK